MKIIRLTKHEAAILDWLLATPIGKKARGFVLVRKTRTTHLEVTEPFDLLDLVSNRLHVADMLALGWKEPSILSLRRKMAAVDVDLGETS